MTPEQMRHHARRLAEYDPHAAALFWRYMQEAERLAARAGAIRTQAWAAYHQHIPPTNRSRAHGDQEKQ